MQRLDDEVGDSYFDYSRTAAIGWGDGGSLDGIPSDYRYSASPADTSGSMVSYDTLEVQSGKCLPPASFMPSWRSRYDTPYDYTPPSTITTSPNVKLESGWGGS